MKNFSDLLIRELKDLYSSTNFLLQILKEMSSRASYPKTIEMLDTYCSQVDYQKNKLHNFFGKHLQKVGLADNPIMEKIRDHALASKKYRGSKEIKDVALLITLNMMQHYEITAFGTLFTHAKLLNQNEILDLLQAIGKKVAEDRQNPLDLAFTLLREGNRSEIQKEVSGFLSTLFISQIRDEQQIVTLLGEIIKEATSTTLKEAVEAYQQEHNCNQDKLKICLAQSEGEHQIVNWSVMEGFTREWKKHLRSGDSKDLKDICIVLAIQKIQHQNMALFEMENVLSEFVKKNELNRLLEQMHEQEVGNDQSFSAIAQGSLFSRGLDQKFIQHKVR